MSIISNFASDKSGNMSVLFALGLGVMLTAVGAATDMSQLTSTRLKAADIADGMALAAAMAAREGKTSEERIALGNEAALEVFASNKASITSGEVLSPIVNIDDITKDVSVTIKANVNYNLMGLFGKDSSIASADSLVSYRIDSVPPISMAFAFDTSGSMGFPADGDPSSTKMEVLQEATQLLFDAMESEAENPDMLKASFSTTFSSFNVDIVDSEDWTTGAASIDAIITYVNAMVPDAGTNSTPSLQYAFDQIITNPISNDPNGRKFVLFMTDGANNDIISNDESLEICNALKEDETLTVITVAFGLKGLPPADEKTAKDFLEDCASSGNFYESDNAKAIKKDFAKIGREIGEVVFRLKS